MYLSEVGYFPSDDEILMFFSYFISLDGCHCIYKTSAIAGAVFDNTLTKDKTKRKKPEMKLTLS